MQAEAADDDSEHVAECDWDCGFVGTQQEVDQHERSCPGKLAATAWRQATVSSKVAVDLCASVLGTSALTVVSALRIWAVNERADSREHQWMSQRATPWTARGCRQAGRTRRDKLACDATEVWPRSSNGSRARTRAHYLAHTHMPNAGQLARSIHPSVRVVCYACLVEGVMPNFCSRSPASDDWSWTILQLNCQAKTLHWGRDSTSSWRWATSRRRPPCSRRDWCGSAPGAFMRKLLQRKIPRLPASALTL